MKGLFRGFCCYEEGNEKIVLNGEEIKGYWVEGDYLCGFLPYIYEHSYTKSGLPCLGGRYTVIPETVGQYTGLTDINGVKIFEGDIVEGLFKYGGAVNSVVEFREGSFGLKWYRGKVEMFWAFPTICNVEYEVIGNIYENPEMLEGK